jgi:hypothetical protein
LDSEHTTTDASIKALDKDEGKTTDTIAQQKAKTKAMAKANSDSITKLGVANKLTAAANKKKIAALEIDNTDRENEIENLKSQEKIDNGKVDTNLGTQES